MALTVWLAANTLTYPEGGGQLWVYLNWALGLRQLGCRVVWLECAGSDVPTDELVRLVSGVREQLRPFGLADHVAVSTQTGAPLPDGVARMCVDLATADQADLLLDFSYNRCASLLPRFRRTALIDIDPGLLQVWLSEGWITLPPHDLYFSTGETVGRPDARFPDGGLPWQYTPPCVATAWWPVVRSSDDAPFTTVSHWETSWEWLTFAGETFHNDKRSGFLPFLDLPRHTAQPLELALCLRADDELRLMADQEEEKRGLEARGWRVRHAHAVAKTPRDYQRYIQSSRGEFSCAKPSCLRLQNAWVSDRTLCYLASGKPAIVQHTGPSRVLPDAAGLFRFRDLQEAARYLAVAAERYHEHSRLARALAEEHFDAATVARSVLERCID